MALRGISCALAASCLFVVVTVASRAPVARADDAPGPDPAPGVAIEPDDGLADARNDIVDIRHGRMPLRTRALGWTAGGEFVLRSTHCQAPTATGFPECSVAFLVAAPGKPTRSNVVFSHRWGDDGNEIAGCPTEMGWPPSPFCWIDQPSASLFLAAERAVLTKLGPLRAGTAQAQPFHLGTRRLALDSTDDIPARLVSVAGRDVQQLEVTVRDTPCTPDDNLCSSSVHVDRMQILSVHESPDGASVAVLSRYVMRLGRWWSGTTYVLGAYPVPSAK